MDLAYIGTLILLILGFGFVVFWHELGHFLAAKWAGVKVEQFAIGFGTAICSWRQGMGFRWGSSGKEYEQLTRTEREGINPRDPGAVGETEYRINWLPLGGYVKMLGQDDLRPGISVDDPRAYNNKPIGHRMIIVSAGVVMNVILAAILFMVLFLMGFRAPPAVVGGIRVNSPAQAVTRADGTPAPLQVGDRILYFDDKYQHDFTKITLAVVLAGHGRTPMYVERVDGTREHLFAVPERAPGDPMGLLALGVMPPDELKGVDPKLLDEESLAIANKAAVRPGETIVAIEGEPVVVGQKHRYDYWKLDRALQESFGKPVEITVRTLAGTEEKRQVRPEFEYTFGILGGVPLDFAGMVPRAAISAVTDNSPAKDKLQPGDAIVEIVTQPQGDSVRNPTREQLQRLLNDAGKDGLTVDIRVIRGGQELEPYAGLTPNLKLENRRRGLGIGLTTDVDHPVIAEVLPDSAAAKAGIPKHATIRSIAGQAVSTWFDVHRTLAGAQPGEVPVEITTREGQNQTVAMRLTPEQLRAVKNVRYMHDLPLTDRIEPRQTSNPLRAAAWGVVETRDLIVQFYLTLQRMAQRRVSPTNLMGPIGIVNAGSKIAYKGTDWLIWFLAMISANLAVVNFLPIPIVDGGLFVFLILEKVMGRPLSPRAQSIAQIVGLALILSVFLFVTYQDINRFF